MVAFPVLIVSLALATVGQGGGSRGATAATSADRQAPVAQAATQQPNRPDPDQTAATAGVPVLSITRIRTLMDAGSTFVVNELPPDDPRPIYRSRIEERAFKLPDFKSTLNTGFAAVPPGGATQYEINRLITPDMYRGMAVFTNQEVLRVLALALRNALLLRGLGWAIDKGMDAWDQAQVARVREEIRQEIAAIEAERLRKAAEIKPPGPDS